jgi:hypothetical protein
VRRERDDGGRSSFGWRQRFLRHRAHEHVRPACARRNCENQRKEEHERRPAHRFPFPAASRVKPSRSRLSSPSGGVPMRALVTAVQIPMEEFLAWLEIPTATREEFELFDEEQALAFLAYRFRRLVALGLTWDHAVVLAVQTDVAF